MRTNKTGLVLLFLCLVANISGQSQSQTQPTAPAPAAQAANQTRTQLPNGWYLTPAGTSIPLRADLPLNMAISPNGRYAAVTNNGNGAQTIDLVDLQEQKVTASMPIAKAWLGVVGTKSQDRG